ncbi:MULTISPECIES: MFS transporter [Saccharopolyspora]|uniref:CynX/NimT family MFS transporter n=1 Tax=Saccharopolyspora TaxID=1835 RepID=UPI001CD81215|nr:MULTISPECIES: MFS transporter [unclassified Saccharopolyspora]MCA1185021.1 MFS transporter [Saccharopolyspora sp. 6T]MCA1190743.1 MFS transporter [Saccharopolyspora sp. 6V]MCA1226240.1 MFS transporter [Saccharopolyspora sp. 6M]MCA1278207.1 MFS transporter [Saccharopolyspora sp. 7B]
MNSTSTTHPAPTGDTTNRPLRTGLVLVGILLTGANLRAGLTVVGPLVGDVRADLGLSSAVASALVSLPLLCFALFSPVAPPLAARFGLERTLGGALAILAVGIVVRSAPWQPALWIGTLALGFAIALINVLLPALIKRDFPQDGGRVTGAYSATQSAFAALASGVAVPLAGVSDSGWRVSFGIWAGLALIGFAVFSPQLRRSTRPRHEVAAALDAHPEQYRSPWKSGLAWMITVSMGTQSALYYCIITWWPEVEAAHGTAPATAGLHLSVLQFFGIAGNLATAAIIHRWARDQRGLIVGLVLINVVGLGGMVLVPALALLWSVLLGLAGGGMIVFSLSVFGLRTRHHGQAAALSGMAQSFGYLLAAFGPTALGTVHDLSGGWTAPLLVLLGLQAVQLVTAWAAASPRHL